MQNLTPSIGTEQHFNHSWELLRVLAGLFEIRKQSGRARLGDVSSTAASEERIFSVSSRTSSGSSHQLTPAQHRPVAQHSRKKDNKNWFLRCALDLLSLRSSTGVSCTGEVSLGTYRCPKIFKRRACARPPKVFWPKLVCVRRWSTAQADSSTTHHQEIYWLEDRY